MAVYKPVGKYDTAGQGYDESAYDMGILADNEAFLTADAIATDGDLGIAENFSITDGIHFIIPLAESFSIADTFIKNVIKNLAEAFSTVDSLIKTGVEAIAESFSTIDSIVTNGDLAKTENFSIIDNISKWSVIINEAFSTVDSLIKNGVRNISEAFNITDSPKYIIHLAETLNIVDTFIKYKLMKIRKIAINFLSGRYESNIELED